MLVWSANKGFRLVVTGCNEKKVGKKLRGKSRCKPCQHEAERSRRSIHLRPRRYGRCSLAVCGAGAHSVARCVQAHLLRRVTSFVVVQPLTSLQHYFAPDACVPLYDKLLVEGCGNNGSSRPVPCIDSVYVCLPRCLSEAIRCAAKRAAAHRRLCDLE